MLYMILCHDSQDGLSRRASARPDHLAYLAQLQDAGRLVLAGPLPRVDGEDPGNTGYRGSLIVAEFESLAAAERWAEQDPYNLAGVFSHVDISPFKRVLPA
ncbi:MAG: YciI family protein [Pseudomonadota bacterium]|nr:YciI family protein [Pseudomonadota bacterium]